MKTIKPKYPNSAGRLLAILEGLQQNQPVSQQLIPIMLGIAVPDNDKQISIYGVKAVTELHILYASFLQDLANAEMTDDERSVLIKGLMSLESLMYPQALNQGMRLVSDAEKALLEVCATRLIKESVISDTDVASIRQSIETLNNTIKDLPVGSVLRNILLELSRLSEDSINRFNIYGAEGLKKAFKGMLAEVAEVYIQDEEKAAKIKESPAWETAVEHLKLFDSVAAKTLKYKPFLETVSKYLLGG